MNVTLLSYTTVTDEVYDRLLPRVFEDKGYIPRDSDLIGEYAGRLCYRSFDKPRPETMRNADYLRNVIVVQHHESIARHASAAFLIENVSRHLLGELTRHHFPGFSVESLRYCPPRIFVLHPTLKADEELAERMGALWARALEDYEFAFDKLTGKGLSTKRAREAAAQYLPLSTATDLVMSANLNTWRDVLSQRLPEGANQEIRELSELLLSELKRLAPATFQDMEVAA